MKRLLLFLSILLAACAPLPAAISYPARNITGEFTAEQVDSLFPDDAIAIGKVSGLQTALDAKLDDSQATAAGLSVLGAADAAAQRTALALVVGTDVLAPSGSGASLTALNATQLTSGTVPVARLPSATTSTNGAVNLETIAAPALAKFWRGGVSGDKILYLGDSTIGSVSAPIWGMITGAANHRLPGGPLAGTTIINAAGAGQTLQYIRSLLAGGGAFTGGGKYDGANSYTTYGTYNSNVFTEAPNLVIICASINDARDGSRSETQMRDDWLAIIDLLRAGIPGVCIAIRMPNPLLPINDGYVTPYTSAQTYTDRMRGAVDQVTNLVPDVLVIDVMRGLFGTTSPNSSSLYADSIHPGGAYERIFEFTGNAISPPTSWTYAPTLTSKAQAAAPLTPWTDEPRALLDTRYFEVVDTGAIGSEWVSGNSYGRVQPDQGGGQFDAIRKGDVLWVKGYTPVLLTANPTKQDATRWQVTQSITETLPASSAYAVYRQTYMGDSNIEAYWKDKGTYPFRYRARVTAAGAGYIRFDADFLKDEFQLTDSSCTLIVVGQTPLALTSYAVSVQSGTGGTGYIQVQSGSTDFSSYVGKQCAVFGSARQAIRSSRSAGFARNGTFEINGSNVPTAVANGSTLTLLNSGTTVTVAQGGTGAATLTGLVKGNGTSAMSAAVAGTDYLAPSGSGAALTGITGTQVANTPAGAISATTVQAALNELDTEKLSSAIPSYADDAAADADGGLAAGALYRTTAGGRTVYRKPRRRRLHLHRLAA